MEQKKRKPTRRERRNGLIINALTLIVLVLLVFEGKSLISLFSRQSIQEQIHAEEEEVFASANLLPEETESETETTEMESEPDTASEQNEKSTEDQTEDRPEVPDRSNGLPDGGDAYMTSVVPEQAAAIDESYFEDAVFIGDSRMEGFRNLSGITKGSFVTAVGMELENFYTDAQIATARGNVLVMDALKNLNYSKIYMMLGTNELGAYNMDDVRENYRKVLADIKTCSSSADPVVYVYSVVYVEESLVTTGDYVNNANVDAVNLEILRMCQEEGYHYINLNEVLSDGSHSLIQGASQDGVHLEPEYCQEWLNYTKTHYIPAV
ncbi:MAG: GDSL-type esterase/lipase family protein [Eubacteriales bacterium]|nr:GDSL-type esterase/lipase family protein [Eubacteriales bacterium]